MKDQQLTMSLIASLTPGPSMPVFNYLIATVGLWNAVSGTWNSTAPCGGRGGLGGFGGRGGA